MTTSQHANEPAAASGLLDASANADIKGSCAAMRRAAQRARQVAQQTGTDLIVVRAGQVVRLAMNVTDDKGVQRDLAFAKPAPAPQ